MMSTVRQVWNGKYEIVKSTGGTPVLFQSLKI